MAEKKNRLEQVYGIVRDVPLTYRVRGGVDDLFQKSLKRNKHLVVYGSSKQGKTSLRKRWLRQDEYIIVQSGNTQTKVEIYSLLLKQAGATVAVSSSRTVSGQGKLQVEFEADAKVPLLGGLKGKGAGEGEAGVAQTNDRRCLEIDPGDPNDIIRVLTEMKFSRYIVIEDFHYLPDETQRALAFDLKAFHEGSPFIFIIVGVWVESNRLALYNGDLTGRLIPVDADQWDPQDLREVVTEGERLLNFRFHPDAKDALVAACQGNVGILQEACYRLCDRYGILEEQDQVKGWGDPADVAPVIAEIANEHSARYRNFIQQFIRGFGKSQLEMYRWIMHVVLTAGVDQLRQGIKFGRILDKINELHPKKAGDVHPYSVSQALTNVGKLQQKYNVKPFILDYETGQTLLKVVDGGFLLYVSGRPEAELLALLSSADAPPDDEDQP